MNGSRATAKRERPRPLIRPLLLALAWVLHCALAPSAPAEDVSVSIAKTFTGSLQDSQAPANVSYSTSSDAAANWSVDIAGKVGAFEIATLTPSLHLTGSGVLEWHRSSYELNPINKGSASGVIDLWQSLPHHDLYLELRYDFTRDFLLPQNSGKASALVSYSSCAVPFVLRTEGHDNCERPKGYEVFRFRPSLGIEAFEKLPLKDTQYGKTVIIADAISVADLVVTPNVKIWLFPATTDRRLTVTGTYAWRYRTGGSDSIPTITHLSSASLDYYLNEERQFAFGGNVQTGRDPARNFLRETIAAVGFKLLYGAK